MAMQRWSKFRGAIMEALVTREAWILVLCGTALLLISWGLESQQVSVWKGFIGLLLSIGAGLMGVGIVMLVVDRRVANLQLEQFEKFLQQTRDELTGSVGTALAPLERHVEQGKASHQKLTDAVHDALVPLANWADKAVTNAFEAAFRRRVPPELVACVEASGFRDRFFRRKHEWHITFELLDQEDCVGVHMHQTFDIHNLTGSEQSFPFSCETEISHEEAMSAELRSAFTHLSIDSQKLSTEELHACVAEVDNIGHKALRLAYPIPIAADAKKAIRCDLRAIRPLREVEVIMAVFPADGIKLTVVAPPALEVTVHALHPQSMKLTPIHTGPRKHGADRPHIHGWQLEAGILVGQGIVLTWNGSRARPNGG